MIDKPKVLAILVYPGGRREQRLTNPDWVVADLEQAAQEIGEGHATYIDPEDLAELMELLWDDEDKPHYDTPGGW